MSVGNLMRWSGGPLLLLGLVSFGLRWFTFSGSEYAPGWDGYFYLVQVKAMVEQGAMHSPDSSPVYWVLRGLYAICGDYVVAYQLLCALLAGIFTALSFWLAKRISGSGATALVVAAWSIFSPSLTFFAGQFPKNLLGMDALLLLLGFSLRRAAWPKVLALGLAFWAHRMTAGLSLVFLLGRRLSWKGLLGVLVFGVGGLGLALLVPGLLRPADFGRFSGAFQAWPAVQGWEFVQLMEPGRMHASWMAEIAIAHVFLAYWLASWWGNRPDRFGLAFFVLVVVLLFPFFQMDLNGMGYRFFLSFMLLAPLLFALIPHVLPRFFFFLVAAVFLCGTIWSSRAYDPETFDPDYGYYEKTSDALVEKLGGKRAELIIGHKGLAELVTFRTGIDVLPWLPEYEVDSTRLWRIAAEIQPMEFRYYLGPDDERWVKPLNLDYALLPESVWQRFVDAVRGEGDEDLLERIEGWRNPSVERPAWLRAPAK